MNEVITQQDGTTVNFNIEFDTKSLVYLAVAIIVSGIIIGLVIKKL